MKCIVRYNIKKYMYLVKLLLCFKKRNIRKITQYIYVQITNEIN